MYGCGKRAGYDEHFCSGRARERVVVVQMLKLLFKVLKCIPSEGNRIFIYKKHRNVLFI
jgi:hypothetical protein